MADLSSLLAVLEHDPDDAQALDALTGAARDVAPDLRSTKFANSRKVISGRGRPDTVVRMIDAELAVTTETARRVDLLLEKGMILDSDLLDVPAARGAFQEVQKLRPDDELAKEALEEIELGAQNWQKFAEKYLQEARGSTDRSLQTGLYMSAAEAHVRFAPDTSEAEAHLRKALDVDPKNTKAAFHLARLLRRTQRWPDLVKLLEQRAEQSPATEERVASLIALATLLRDHGHGDQADAAIRRVLVLDPAQPQALRSVGDGLAAAGNWRELVTVYQAAVNGKSKDRTSDDDVGLLLQIGMMSWRHLNDLDGAEEYFKRLRKLEPAHPAALDFYRAYYTARGEHDKLIALLKSVGQDAPVVAPASGVPEPQRTTATEVAGTGKTEVAPGSTGKTEVEPGSTGRRSRPVSIEIAELSEQQNNPEKAIEAWKQVLRQEPGSPKARAALLRLYRKTEKWNALLDLMKDDIEKEPELAAKVQKLLEVVEIYRDKLRLDVMVINTYNAILKLDPDNVRATDELAAKFRALGRWNDLIAVLSRKAESTAVPVPERVAILREIADLWADRFGNFANAIKPLEKILEIMPSDGDAVSRLKEIYTKRRQWRALIDVLGREASALPPVERRAKQSEMARLAAERLGDTRLSIEILNSVLAEATGADGSEALASLATLYDREKRHLALAEILHRQVALAQGNAAVVLYEKLGQIYADRLGAPQLAAEQWQAILELEPNHARALRTLRELYATAGDFAGLERMYAKLGQADELVDALLGIADRLDAKAARLPIVERAAQLAQERADKVGKGEKTESGKTDVQALERARQVWERVLAVEPTHVGAATALVPIYTKQDKTARLITMHEIELSALAEPRVRLAKVEQIRSLCEHKLSSRTLAFTWTIRAFDLDPGSEAMFAEVLRLANEPEQWREVIAAFERGIPAVDPAAKLRLYRELAKIATRRLGDPERARAYHRQVLALEPSDRVAEQLLEELAIQLADWPELLASYRRRAAREKDATERASLLLEIAGLQEERLVDLDGAATTYREVLATAPGQLQALRSLARIEEARGDWDALVGVLATELEQIRPAGGQGAFELLMRLGELEEKSREQPSAALVHYRDAYAIHDARGGVRPQAIAALIRIGLSSPSSNTSGSSTKITPAERVAIARLILPHLEQTKQTQEQALALEIIRTGSETAPAEKLEIDRILMRLYHIELGDPAAAWSAGLRVIAAEPTDADVRGALSVLAGQLGRDGEWAKELATALERVRAGDSTAEIRAIATELALVAGTRLDDKPSAERAWLVVLEVEQDAADAFEALTAMYRGAERWQDLRALLDRRTDVSLDDRVRLAVLLELAALEEDVLGEPSRAAAAHRRALELDATYQPSYQALDRLYTNAKQWKELEELLARQADQLDQKTAKGTSIALAYRRAELFAHELGDPGRAVDLLEDIIGRLRGHADARELLEELLPKQAARPDLGMRIARLLEPLYESDKLWKDLVMVLRAQRALVTGTEAVELLSRIATIEETELSGARHAFEAWAQVLGLDPTHERARVELVRLAQSLGRWSEATIALEAAVTAAPPGDVATRGALLDALASYYDLQAADAPRAIATYRKMIETDPMNPSTIRRGGAALARLYEDEGAWKELRDITRKQAEWAESPDDRRALLAHAAALEEDKLADRTAAITTWREVLNDAPGDASALNALERLYQAAEKWQDLVEILRQKLDSAAEPTALLFRIAELHEAMLDQRDEAIIAYLEIIEVDPANTKALGELARLYRAAERYVDLLEIHERQFAQAPALDTLVKVAQLLAGPLGRPVEALDKWAEILRHDSQHPVALAAVEAALDEVDLRHAAAEILQPIYESNGQHDRLATLLLRVADWSDDTGAKLRAYQAVVRIREYQLGDPPGAFAAQLLALSHAAAEPELAQVVADTERLAGELGREADLIDAYRQIAPNVLDSEVQRRLYLDIADLSRAVRRDLDVAGEYYQKVLEAQPDDRRALIALESIYRETNDHERLTEVLLRQADTAGADVDDRVGALVEAAGLYLDAKRIDDSIATWEQVLAVAPERRDAAQALDELYRGQGRWPDVVDLYERRLGFATTVDEAVGLQVALGEIHEVSLRDIETAIDNYSAALSGDPRNVKALAAVERYLGDPDVRAVAAEVLEPIYVAQQRWTDLIRVYEAKLEGTSDPRERLKITRFVARLYEEQLEDFENASRWFARVFREAPSDATTRDQLQRLASVVENWDFVAFTYQGFLDEETGDPEVVREVAIAAATIYDRRLSKVSEAYAAYRKALAIDVAGAHPDERELIRRLEDLLGRAQQPTELVQIYDDVIARAGDDLRRDALVKRARLVETALADQVRAIDGWREVVLAAESGTTPADDLAYRDAVAALERLYRARSQWPELVELFEARLARSLGTPEDERTNQVRPEAAQLRLSLAELHELQRDDIGAAIDQYEQVIAEQHRSDAAVASLERLVIHEDHRERIAELLEPVYRRRDDWWQKLVVILDAKLAYMRDPVDQIATLHEIAEIHEVRGGSYDLALAALARAWRIDVAEDDSLQKLLSLAGKLEAWDETVKTIEEGAPSASDSDLVAGLWARAAAIHEQQRGDNPSAIAAWRKVFEARPDDLVALAALDRLLAVERRPEELVKVVARRAELVDDAGVRLVLLHRVASLHEEVLEDQPAAIATYRSVLEIDDADPVALDALERLYAATGDGRELVGTLERKIELAAEPSTRRELRHAAAQVYERQLNDVYQAIGQYVAILDEGERVRSGASTSPMDVEQGEHDALAALDRIYAAQNMWPDLLDIIDRRAVLALGQDVRADFAYRAARLVEIELADPDQAVARYGGVLGMVPGHAQARAALEALMVKDEHVAAVTPVLERVYRANNEIDGLVRVYERRLATPADDPAARLADWSALAQVHEQLANKPANAFAVWARAIDAEPDDASLLAQLDRLAQLQGMWAELAAKLDALLEKTLSPDVEQTYAMRLGQIAEDKLANLDRAAAAFDRATNGPTPRPALAALERVLARSGRWQDLAAVLRREADASDDDTTTAEYLYRLGDLQETTLHATREAIAAYREVLGIAPEHVQARGALERVLAARPEAGEVREIVEILEPLYDQDGDAARLVMILEAKLGITEDALDRASLLGRIVEISEDQLADLPRSLDAALRWLAVDPSSHQALATTDRLAERLGQWPDVAARVEAIVHTPEARTRERDVQVGLLAFLGSIQRERIGDLEGAAASYRGALALDPDSLTALDPLIEIYRHTGNGADLADALRQRGRVVTDPSERRAAYAEVGRLCEQQNDRAAAIAAWREIADNDDNDREALDELARIYRFGSHAKADDRAALIDVLGRAARLAGSGAEEKQLRVEIARLETESPRAIAAWQAVVDLDPDDAGALAALETAHARAGDWAAVADMQGRRLALAKSNQERIQIHAEMAKLSEDKRQSVDDAIAAWFAVLDLDSSYLHAYEELERLLVASSRWHDVVDLLERRAELAAVQGDGPGELAILARAADIWEGKLDNPDAAGEILEKILAREPGSVAALTRLSKIYERNGDWEKTKATLQQALALAPTGRDAADLFFRLAEVARVGDADPDSAMVHLQHALQHDPAHPASITALEKLAREKGNAALLADMLQRRVHLTGTAAERVGVYVEIADLERKANRIDAALAALASAAKDAPADPRVLGPLADLYFAANRHDEAAPIYEKLAEEAKAARRMKDVARFRQRQGGILEARGDRDAALLAYEEALRVNPSDASTMSGLGRLYFAAQEWEKARKIYQSLVLQTTIDPEAGVTKAEVYWALGSIHLQLGQPPKAKSMFQRGLEIEPQNERLKQALAQVQ